MTNKSNEIIFLDPKGDISINLSGYGNHFYFSIYNDKTDKAVATEITRQKLKELAEFLNKYFEHN